MQVDILNNSKSLRAPQVKREIFNPRNKLHRQSLKVFLETGSWGIVQFFAEAPYITVPETVLRKMASHAVGK